MEGGCTNGRGELGGGEPEACDQVRDLQDRLGLRDGTCRAPGCHIILAMDGTWLEFPSIGQQKQPMGLALGLGVISLLGIALEGEATSAGRMQLVGGWRLAEED